MRTFRLVPTLVVLALSACHGVQGSGKRAEEAREVPAFHAISVRSGLRLTVTRGTPVSVKVSGDDNLVPDIVTTVVDGTLAIQLKKAGVDYATSIGLAAEVTVPSLDALDAAEGAEVAASGLHEDLFAVSASGGSELSLSGTVETLAADASGGSSLTLAGTTHTLALAGSGGSDIDAGGLPVVHATVHLSGGSEASLKVSGDLAATLSGGSEARVQGGPQVTTQEISPDSSLDIQ